MTTPSMPETLDDVQPSLNGHGPLPTSECYCILMMQHARYEADTQRLTSLGLHSMYSRLTQPTTSREEANKLHLRKQRLQMQISKRYLQNAGDPQEEVSVLEQVQRRSSSRRKLKEAGKTTTFFDVMEGDLIGIQSRSQLGIVVNLLFEGRGLMSPAMFYPTSSVIRAPQGAKCKGDEYVSVPSQWATITFVSPLVEGSTDVKEADEYTRESEEQYISTLQGAETAEQVVARLHPPDDKSRELLQRLLQHLESRGVVWTRAGQGTVPSARNKIPRERPEFAVLGLFPKSFFDRCKVHHRSGEQMPADIMTDAKSKHAPLIVSPSDQANQEHKSDFLEGWYIRTLTEEPYRRGIILEDSASFRQGPTLLNKQGVQLESGV